MPSPASHTLSDALGPMIFLSDFFTAETHLPREVCSGEVIAFQSGSPILRGFLMFHGETRLLS